MNTTPSVVSRSAVRAHKRSLHVASLAAFLVVVSGSALAQAVKTSTPPAATEPQVSVMEAFSVTGSNILMNASEADKGRLPIEFIPAEKFQFTSGERLGDYLRLQPFIAGSYLSAGNINAGGYTSVSIHGVGRNYTLQLVDGRRMSQEDTVPDISGVPPEAIESTDVLKGGASAIYGSSAVGGVLNMKLLKRFSGVETLLSYGGTTYGDGIFKRAAVIFGKKVGNLSVVGSISTSERSEVSDNDREPTNTSDFRKWGGLDRRLATSGDPMRIAVTGNATPLILDLSRFKPGQTGTAAGDYVPWSQNLNTIGTVPYTLIAKDRRTQGHWAVEYEVFGKQLVAFATGYWDIHQTQDRTTAAVVTVTVPAANPYNPFKQTATVFYRFNGTELNNAQANLVHDVWDTWAYQGVFGLRGEYKGFTYDMGVNNASLDRTQNVTNDVARELAQLAVNRTDATALNVFGYNANSQTQTAGIAPPHSYKFRNKLTMLDFKITGPIMTLPTGIARFALGAENRRTGYQRIADANWLAYNYGVTGNGASVNTPHYQRTADAYFGEATVPVLNLKNDHLPISSMEVNGALRRDTYSDFKGTTIHSLSLSTRGFNDSLVLRALVAQGVRAPFAVDLKAPNATSILNGLFDPVRGGVFPVTRITGGNLSLKEERADTRDYGVVYSPPALKGVTLRADYWSVDIKDRIFAPAPQDILNGIASGGSLTRDPVTGNVTIDARSVNGTERAAAGYDFGIGYSLPTALHGRFAFDLTGTYTTQLWDKSSGVTSVLLDHYAGSTNLSGGGGGTEPIPRLQAVFTAFWYYDNFNAGLTAHHHSGLHDTVVGLIDRQSEPYYTADLQVSYNIKKESTFLHGALRNTRLSLGVDNIWDEAVPFVASTTTGWDQNISDPRGRYIYMSVRKKF